MILDEIAEYTKERVRALKAHKSLYAVRDEAEGRPQGKDFRAALAAPGLSVIAELKKASPSKGVIAPDFTDIYLRKAAEYEAGGAAAISCLTEPQFFQGSDAYLQAVRQRVELPLLRKDFTLDEYQIYEAKCIGADAVLLICSLLSAAQLGEYLAQAQELGLSALVEAHTAGEVQPGTGGGRGNHRREQPQSQGFQREPGKQPAPEGCDSRKQDFCSGKRYQVRSRYAGAEAGRRAGGAGGRSVDAQRGCGGNAEGDA